MVMRKWSLYIQSRDIELERSQIYLLGGLEAGGQSPVYIALPCESLDAKHCTIEVLDGTLQILDLCSQSGTFVNNKRLEPLKKVSVNAETTIRFGMLSGELRLQTNRESLESSGSHEQQKVLDTSLNKSSSVVDDFLIPEAPLSKSQLVNTSRRLFDDESFIIPETQHAKLRVSTGSNHSISNTCGENLMLKKEDVEDDSYIPETQQPLQSAAADNAISLSDADANVPKSCSMFRICTQDFNENLFGDDDNDDPFTSLVIPNIQHKPVILENVLLADCRTANSLRDTSKEQNDSCDAEMDALNWTAQTVSRENTAQSTQCLERDDTRTPDLFDLPELAQANAQITPQKCLPKQNFCAAAAEENALNNQFTTTPVDGEPKDAINEMELLPTQVFKPIRRKEEQQEDAPSEKLSLSGKENYVPENVKISLEATQVFSKSKGEEEYNNNNQQLEHISPPEEQENLQSISLYPATQVFSAKIGTRQNRNASIPKKALNSTLTSTLPNEQVKSAAGFIAGIENTLRKPEEKETVRIEVETDHSFKKPKSESSVKGAVSAIDNNLLVETEDLQLCTPKWISDNFDKLAQEQSTIAVKRRTLFGSDSEDELDNINKLVQKKVSNDFGKLLSKIEINNDANPNNETKKEANQLLKRNSISAKRSKRPATDESKSQEKPREKIQKLRNRAKRLTESTNDSDETILFQKGSSTSSKEPMKEDIPARRSTRLRSLASTVTNDDLQPKQINNNNNNKQVTKTRLKRLSTKSETSDSVITIKVEKNNNNKKSKSKESYKKQSKQQISSSSAAQQKTSSITSSHETLNGLSGSAKPESQENYSFSTSTSTRKRKEAAATEEGRKQLRSTSTRPYKLQVATTMVDIEHIQRLLDNSAGNWCLSKDPTEADVLIMDKGTRTLKFLLAMAKGIPIVSSKWLEAFNATKMVPKGMEHFFKDPEFEKRHKFSLLKSLDMARKKKLFEGYEFLTTSTIVPQPSEIREIIKSAGGILHSEVPQTKDNQKIYLVSASPDKKHWHKYRRANANICITSTEGVMAAVMRQQTDPLDKHRLSQ